jgi:hypothetical protein
MSFIDPPFIRYKMTPFMSFIAPPFIRYKMTLSCHFCPSFRRSKNESKMVTFWSLLITFYSTE